MPIRFFDMFAGIGGFRSGLEAVGGYKCIGHCEIDKYANQAYNAISSCIVCKSEPFSGNREALAWKSRTDEIDV